MSANPDSAPIREEQRATRLSDAEWTVMRAVWNRTPASARDVLDQVGEQTGWAYTTVKTLLARLVEKGALSESRRANTNVYEPRITRNEARGSALRSLLDRAFDGTFGSLLQHLMTEERLSRHDLQALERMLQESEPSAAPASETRPAARRAKGRR
jgi:BlaI family transcriptional regulator, penicillinase repressor